MAIDTQNERRVILRLPPVPDLDINNAPDRRQMLYIFPLPDVVSFSQDKATLGEMSTAILYRLGDTEEKIWSTAEIQSYVRAGYDELTFLSRALWIKASPAGLDDVDGQAIHTVPEDLLGVERITWDSKRLHPFTVQEAERYFPNYQTQQGQVIGYLMESDGLRVLRKIMIPNQTVAGLISIEYWRRGTLLADSSSEIELPIRYTKYIQWYALWKALGREGAGQDLKLSQHYGERWVDGVDRLSKRRESVHRQRVHVLGGGERSVPRRGARPVLPSNYGQVVR